MTSISQNIRYLPHDLNTKFYAVQSYRNGNRAEYVCRKENIIFLKLPYLVGIEDSMVLKNLLLTNHIAH